MTADRITAAIDALAEAEAGMTPGEWLAYRGANGVICMLPPGVEQWDTMSGNPNNDNDNRGIVAWRNAAPAIVEVLRAAPRHARRTHRGMDWCATTMQPAGECRFCCALDRLADLVGGTEE